MCRVFLLLFILVFPLINFAQSNNSTKAVIQKIIISGNKKTKEKIIKRELDFKEGDTISILKFEQRILLSKKRLYNTRLFNLIEINFKGFNSTKGILNIHIDLVENLFIYPVPIFDFADRNFNVWWKEQNHSLSRINYGIRLDHINTTGVQDRLKIKFQLGYTHKYEIKYRYPYLKNNLGFGAHIFYADQKEIGYITLENKTVFHRSEDERILLKRFRTGIEAKYRPNHFLFQTVKLEFHRNKIDPIIAEKFNPDYFLNGINKIRFFMLEYNLDYNNRIFNIYPEAGYRINFNVKKEGIGVFKDYNNIPVFLDIDKHFKIRDGIIASIRCKAKANLLRNDISFANNTGLGYLNNIVGGYELYVLDGSDFVLSETQFKIRVLNKLLKIGEYMPISGFKKMDIKIFLRGNFDFAYANEKKYIDTNSLNNKWIFGYGPALDILLFHNFLFMFEYSFNQQGESGLFIHNKIGF